MDELKQKSISQMTVKELGQLNRRLEKELDIEQLIMRVKRTNGEKWDEHTRPTVNTTTPIQQLYPQYDDVFKNKSISQMTMDELNLLQERLREETRAQDRILELKRMSGEQWDWDNQPAVNTDIPVSQLYHHGILGMKWGVRRKSGSSGRTTSAAKTDPDKKEERPKSEDHMESRILRKKSPSGLSNAELKRLNERLNLEKQYKDLTKNDTQKGKNFLSDAVNSGLKQTASTVVAASSLYTVKKLIEKSMGSDAAAEMFPTKKK